MRLRLTAVAITLRWPLGPAGLSTQRSLAHFRLAESYRHLPPLLDPHTATVNEAVYE